jgi:Domain of unknown function (DUF4129)
VTARQQIVRLLPLVLLIVLVVAGLRGIVPSPRWNGPLRADGIAIGIAVEVVFAALVLAVRGRDRAARRAAESMAYDPAAVQADIEPPQALRFTLTWVLAACMAAVAVVLLTNVHLHFFVNPRPLPTPKLHPPGTPRTLPKGGGGGFSLHVPWGPILYALLVIAIVAALVVSIWLSSRLRRPAAPLVITDVGTEGLAEAVAEGRAALAVVDDARAAIIACYVAMERSLAERGAARAVADTPDELLGRAVSSGVVRGGGAGRLTALFYEARFSTHPLRSGQRDAAIAALDELAAELAARKAAEEAEEARRAAESATATESAAAATADQATPGGDHRRTGDRPSRNWSSRPSPWPSPPWRAGPSRAGPGSRPSPPPPPSSGC